MRKILNLINVNEFMHTLKFYTGMQKIKTD
jgi:hypothetical protein